MTADTNDCQSDYDPNSLTLQQARDRIVGSLETPNRSEELNLHRALHRVLAEPIQAPRDVPPFRNSAMDGFACRSADLPETGSIALNIVGQSLAGHAYPQLLGKDEAIQVTTGAALPDNADVVVMQERAHLDSDRISFDVRDAQNKSFVRTRGSDTRQGDTVMQAGTVLGPAQIAVLASLGIAKVRVFVQVRVAIVSTGDELVDLGQTPAMDQIFDSNRPALLALLQHAQIEVIDLGICRDCPQEIRDRLLSAAEQADLVISSGGVSVGTADHLRSVLEEIGELNFWKISVKPGRPLTFGKIQQTHYFGLPGNPVSTMVTFQQLVEPALRTLAGETLPSVKLNVLAQCESPLKKQAGRQEFQRGILRQDATGKLLVSATGAQDSHMLSSVSKANCLIELAAESTGAHVGESVRVQLI